MGVALEDWGRIISLQMNETKIGIYAKSLMGVGEERE